MADTYACTTQLEAVNEMLTSVGFTPIANLETSGRADAALAKMLLHNVSRKVQAEGWHFNSEEEYPLAVNGDSKIPVPSNALQIDSSKSGMATYDVVKRGSFLYDRYNKTFTFTETLKVDIVWFLAFEDLPESAREYITIQAARQFQTRVMGSSDLHSFTERDELMARVNLESDDANNADHNILTGSQSTLEIVTRDVFIGR